ncbi:hypothetical protein M9979_07180 [Sphingomonas sp. RP10(2022)]|uniref:DUF3558 domain-containing protein n=1 Tax=Sphingomonas liriopis TaxID=2949094 RepID=A0A9X2KQ80_9SPHN|nr:hypothetical protein [Sphingomonas liriopis]MCP3734652.1 hypothetical protein [Sphingomonas liriopis]
MRHAWMAVLLAATLAGCGGNDGRSGDATATADGWDERDACKTLPKERVATLLRGTVIKAELAAVQDDRDYDTFSQCSYTFDDGRIAVVGTGHLVSKDPLADQVEKQRAQANAAIGPTTPLAGVGKAALYAPNMNMLWAFLGDGRYLQINLAQIVPGQDKMPADTLKAQVIALARALGA